MGSLITEFMREGAEKTYHATQLDDGWHGFEMIDHPTPSGCSRPTLTYSDNRSWPTKEEAIRKIKDVVAPFSVEYVKGLLDKQLATTTTLSDGGGE